MGSLDRHIDVTPGIAGGRPRIAGRRITVRNIAVWHDHMGKSADEIAAEYDLSLADIYAALAYYFDHQAEIDREIEESEKFLGIMRKNTSSKLKAKLRENSTA
ncbi:MAG: DUF433 domain-containing protein [Candidatus Electrothrix sp. MAN1_4]|nr:DUF433 domain-containing protein [Candidatus Electrothrix sp. MAN1_4]